MIRLAFSSTTRSVLRGQRQQEERLILIEEGVLEVLSTALPWRFHCLRLEREQSEFFEFFGVALDQREGVFVLIAQLLGELSAIHVRLAPGLSDHDCVHAVTPAGGLVLR